MIDPKDVTPGLWYVSQDPPLDPYTVVEVDNEGRVFGLGGEQYFSKFDDYEFIGPVPPPSDTLPGN